jgi:hypothetical protein
MRAQVAACHMPYQGVRGTWCAAHDGGSDMRKSIGIALVPAVMLLAACGGRVDDRRMDDALSRDLSLAGQVQPMQYVSPIEQGYAPMPVQRVQQPVYQQPVRQVQQPVYRQPVQQAPQQVSYPAPAPRGEPIRNTKRDAIIGAAAGAAIGAATSRDKVKGAIVGGAIGGVAGAIIGHTVDVQHPPR